MSLPPYRVAYSGVCRDRARELMSRASLSGRSAELAQAIRDIDTRLKWIPLDFGEPLRDFPQLGLQERIASVPPLVVTFAVDEARHIVYVARPFTLLPNSGL
jgi:hypothetical protein